MSIKKLLIETKQSINTMDKWCQKSLFNRDKHCILGAMYEVPQRDFGSEDISEAIKMLNTIAKRTYGANSTIVTVNDGYPFGIEGTPYTAVEEITPEEAFAEVHRILDIAINSFIIL